MGSAKIPVSILFETAEQFVKKHHLAGRLHEPIDRIQVFIIPPVLLLGCAEEEWVVAAFFELNDDIQEGDLRAFPLHGA